MGRVSWGAGFGRRRGRGRGEVPGSGTAQRRRGHDARPGWGLPELRPRLREDPADAEAHVRPRRLVGALHSLLHQRVHLLSVPVDGNHRAVVEPGRRPRELLREQVGRRPHACHLARCGRVHHGAPGQVPERLPVGTRQRLRPARLGRIRDQHRIHRPSQLARDRLHRRAAQPFFLWVSYTAPHNPAARKVPARYTDADVYVTPSSPNLNEAEVSDKPAGCVPCPC